MAIHLQLYLDTTENKLVKGPNDPTQYVLPKMFFEADIDMDVTLLRRKEGGGFTEPFEYIGNAEALTVAIGNWSGVTGTKLASQNTWTLTTANHYLGQLNLNTASMVAALTGEQTIAQTFEIQWGNGQTFQTAVTVSGEVITAGSPDPDDYTDTEFADAVEAVMIDGDTVDFTRIGDEIEAEVIKKSGGRLGADANGLYVTTPMVEIGGVQAAGTVAIQPDEEYRVIVGNYNCNAIATPGTVAFELSATDREEGDILFLHVNLAENATAAVTITIDSTADVDCTHQTGNPQSLNAILYFDGTIWALLSCQWSDGTLAAGTFTPTYPTPLSVLDETEIQLETPSAAGSDDYDPNDEKAHSVLHITPGTGAGSYTYDYIIQQPGGSGEPAPFVVVFCDMPQSNNPTIRIYDEGPTAGSGDDVLLATFKGTVRGARRHTLFMVWDGSAYSTLLDDEHYRALGYHPVWIPAAAMISRTTNGASTASQETSTTKTMLETLSFPGEVTGTPTDTHAQFAFGSPGGWDESDVLVQFEWYPFETGSTLDCVWAAQAKCIGDNGDPDAAWGTATQVSDTVQTVGYKHVSAWINGITPANANAADMIFWQFTREASDILDTIHDGASGAVDCDLHGVRLLFHMDQLNDDETSKTNP